MIATLITTVVLVFSHCVCFAMGMWWTAASVLRHDAPEDSDGANP